MYGNYDAYYGYRYAGGVGVRGGGVLDPRLDAMSRDWFEGKDCLDIGCNAGQVTVAIAAHFRVRSMLGVDIDAKLIRRARSLLKSAQPLALPAAPSTTACAQAPASASASALAGGTTPPCLANVSGSGSGGAPAPPERATSTATGRGLSNDDFRRMLLHRAAPSAAAAETTAPAKSLDATSSAHAPFPISFGICWGGLELSSSSGARAQGALTPSLLRTRFEHCNFVQDPPAPAQPGTGQQVACFDVVTCLSTSKWVHLNFGDSGLKRLFARAHACLRPGGRFILEPQPWTSYRKRATLTPLIQAHFRAIELRPDAFVDFLLSPEGGFSSCERLDVPYAEGDAAGFKRRPLVVLTK